VSSQNEGSRSASRKVLSASASGASAASLRGGVPRSAQACSGATASSSTPLNAGSYSVIAIAAPSSAQVAYSCARLSTRDQNRMPAPASAAPSVITISPRPRSIAAPTAWLLAPQTARPALKAPISSGLLQPSARCIGSTKDENA
jgi:hypothetical protein